MFDLKINHVAIFPLPAPEKKKLTSKLWWNLKSLADSFVDWCVQDIIHLNQNFDLQWISPVSERNRGSTEIQTCQCNMTQTSWWTNDRKQMSHCDVDLRQVNKSMIDWISKNVVKLWAGQLFGLLTNMARNLSRAGPGSFVLMTQNNWSRLLWQVPQCSQFHEQTAWLQWGIRQQSERPKACQDHESKFSWLSPNDVAPSFLVMWTNSSCVLVAVCQMRNFWLNNWLLASWQRGLGSQWHDKSVAQVKMRKHRDSAFECGIVWWIRQFHSKLLTTQPSFVAFLVTRAFSVVKCAILFQHSYHSLDMTAFKCCLHEFSFSFSWCIVNGCLLLFFLLVSFKFLSSLQLMQMSRAQGVTQIASTFCTAAKNHILIELFESNSFRDNALSDNPST